MSGTKKKRKKEKNGVYMLTIVTREVRATTNMDTAIVTEELSKQFSVSPSAATTMVYSSKYGGFNAFKK